MTYSEQREIIMKNMREKFLIEDSDKEIDELLAIVEEDAESFNNIAALLSNEIFLILNPVLVDGDIDVHDRLKRIYIYLWMIIKRTHRDIRVDGMLEDYNINLAKYTPNVYILGDHINQIFRRMTSQQSRFQYSDLVEIVNLFIIIEYYYRMIPIVTGGDIEDTSYTEKFTEKFNIEISNLKELILKEGIKE